MELIKITQNEQGEQLVSGRELHEKLEITERFNRWFERMLKYGFVENIDFTSVKSFTVVNNGARKEVDEYILKLDMAKQICMLQRSELGSKFRMYFIECEKKLKEITQATQQQRLYERSPQELLADNAIALNRMFESLNLNIPKELIVSTAIDGTRNSIGYDFPEVRLLLNKQDEEQYHSASGLLGRLGVKRNRTNETLVLLGLQIKGTTTMQPYALTELGKEYGVERTYTNKGHQGYEIKWKETLLGFVKDNFENIPKEFIK